MSARRDLFAYVIVGDSQVPRLNHSLRFLKQFSRQDIVVVASRCRAAIHHEQILRPRVPARFDDHQASILLKTNLHRVLGQPDRPCCYLDSDVIAVDPRAGGIFSRKRGPVTFAADHVTLGRFSRFAVRCSCVRGECGHLRQSIREKFGVEVRDPGWQHWNGGVYLFDSESTDFLDTWHAFTRAVFEDPFWKTRDQGTLIATVWKYGLERQATLDPAFNYIVDPMRQASESTRAGMQPDAYSVDHSYSLTGEPALARPFFLHFINGAVGAAGWKNWDDAVALLA
jgi:hypothetical protein